MIQFNLLPDIKLEYIKARRTKRMIMLIAFIVSGSAVGLFVLLLVTVHGFQKTHINNLTDDINAKKAELDQIKDLDKILTIQNQLNSLGGLHDQKPVVTRFYTYLPQLVPAKTGNQILTLSDVTVSFTDTTMSFSGSADSLATINKFVDTLKFATFENQDGADINAFSEVKLSSHGTQEGENSYKIDLKFDPLIFDSSQDIQLKVPDIISTRSETEKPSEELFKQQAQPSEEGETQ